MGILFQNLEKSDERNIDRAKFTTGFSILFYNSHSCRPLLHYYFVPCFDF